MNQDDLDALHSVVRETVQMWADRLITDLEFTEHIADIHMAMDGANPAGLLDSNTGLRYPTK
jgi:hypothetical protein